MANDDFDISCFLQDPDSEDYMLPLSSDPDAPHADGQHQQAPAEQVQADPPAPPQMPKPAPEKTVDAENHPAPTFGTIQRPNVDIPQHPAPTTAVHQQPIIIQYSAADQVQAPPAPPLRPSPAPPQMPNPAPELGFQFQAPSADVGQHPAPVFEFQPPSIDLQQHEAPTMANHLPGINAAEQYQPPPPLNNYAPPTIGGEQHQAAPADMDVDEPPTVNAAANNQAPTAEVHQGPGDVPLWHQHEDPEAPLGSPSLYDHDFLIDEEEPDTTDMERSIEDGIAALGGARAELDVYPAVEEDPHFVPYVHGQLDCSQCCTVRKVLHQGESHKTYFIVHAANPRIFQHAILNRFYIGPDGNQNVELQYLDLRSRTQEWIYNFVWESVQSMQNDKSGQMQDSLATSAEQARTNISEPVPNNDAHVELEIQMLKTILNTPAAHAGASGPETSLPVRRAQAAAPEISLPVTQAQAAAPETSLPVTQAEAAVPPETSLPAPKAKENTSNGDPLEAPIDWATFRPVILESSLVGREAEVESSSSALLYPSMVQKKQKRESNKVSMEDARKYLRDMKEEAAKEPDLSAPPFRLLSRRLKHYRMHMSRMNEIKKKIRKLEILVPRHEHNSAGLFTIMQKLELFRREKRDLIAAIMEGLQQMVKQSEERFGASGSKPN